MTGTPLVISGVPRSGTTLLYNLLDGHPEVSWLVTEAYFFEYLHDLGVANEAIYRQLAAADIDSLIDGLRDRAVIPPLQAGYKQVFPGTMETAQTFEVPWDDKRFRDALGRLDFTSIGTFWRGLARACLDAMGAPEKRYVCVKSPDYGKSAFASIAAVPDARAILILRNPVLALDSLKFGRANRGVKRLTWPTLALLIAEHKRMFETLERTRDERLLVVRYEDLAAAPETQMRTIADWLGIAFAPCLLEPTFLGQSWSGHSTQRMTKGIDSGLAVRKPKYLTERELTVIQSALEVPMRKHGYL